MRPALPTGNGSRVFSGARCLFSYNGEVVAWASGVSGTRQIQYDPVDVLDNLAPAEYVPVGYRVNFSAQIFRTIAINGTQEGSLTRQNIFPSFSKILYIEGVDALITDEITKQILYKLKTCKAESENFSIQARAIVGQNVGFNAIQMLEDGDELTP